MTDPSIQSPTVIETTRNTRQLVAALAVVLGASVIPFTNYLPSTVAYSIVLLAYLLFFCVAVYCNSEIDLAIPRWAVVALGIVWTIYLGHLFSELTTGSLNTEALVRVPPFLLLTGLNLFLVPRVVSRREYYHVLSRIAAVLVLLGLPTLFVDRYSLVILEIVSYRGDTVPFTTISHNVVSSVFANPNPMSFVALVGFLAALGEFVERKGRAAAVVASLNAIGLYLAHGRSSMLAGVAGVGLFVLYFLLSRRTFRIAYLLGGTSCVLIVLMVMGFLPGPGIITNVNVTGRPTIWAGGIEAVLSRPVFGFGAGETGEFMAPFISGRYSGFTPHNSYLRVFVETGIVGGVAYLLFVVKTILSKLFGDLTPADLTTLVLCSAITVSMIFRGYTLFGISIMSVVAAMTFGYGIQTVETGTRASTETDTDRPAADTKPSPQAE